MDPIYTLTNSWNPYMTNSNLLTKDRLIACVWCVSSFENIVSKDIVFFSPSPASACTCSNPVELRCQRSILPRFLLKETSH